MGGRRATRSREKPSQEAAVTAQHFSDKARARRACWDALSEAGAARFPLPPHGRIPNFAGAEAAAALLLEHSPLAEAKVVKANPDAPQRPLRAALLERGVDLYMPAPRLRAGFMHLDPRRIPAQERRRAVSLSNIPRYATSVRTHALPAMDAVICGSVAVTENGHRCGKGEGYSDLEYAVLQELGLGAPPVVTTVHELQLVRHIPRDSGDLPVHWIATPIRVIRVRNAPPPPPGIDWSKLSPQRLEAMPILDELRESSAR